MVNSEFQTWGCTVPRQQLTKDLEVLWYEIGLPQRATFQRTKCRVNVPQINLARAMPARAKGVGAKPAGAKIPGAKPPSVLSARQKIGPKKLTASTSEQISWKLQKSELQAIPRPLRGVDSQSTGSDVQHVAPAQCGNTNTSVHTPLVSACTSHAMTDADGKLMLPKYSPLPTNTKPFRRVGSRMSVGHKRRSCDMFDFWGNFQGDEEGFARSPQTFNQSKPAEQNTKSWLESLLNLW